MLTLASPAWPQSCPTQFGVNEAGLEFGSVFPGVLGTDYFLPSQAGLNYFVAQGTNGLKLFRLPFSWERIQPGGMNTTIDPTYLSYLKTFLYGAAAAGGHVILDLHNGGQYNGTYLGNGAVTGAAFANVWGQIAAAVACSPALVGYDIMNEPQGFNTGVEWPNDAQLAINAIRAVDTQTPIYLEGDCISAAWNWGVGCNLQINAVSDPANKIIWEAHQYPDADSSGQFLHTYDQDGVTCGCDMTQALAARIAPFANWLQANNFVGIIGEYGVPDNDARWLTTLDNGLTYMDQQCIGGTYWAAGQNWGTYPLSVEPIGGADRPQMSVLKKHTGATCGSAPPPNTSFTLGGYTFTKPTFLTDFSKMTSLNRIAGNVATASSSFDWYTSQNTNGPTYGATNCCGTCLEGIDNTTYNPYSLVAGEALKIEWQFGKCTGTMQTVANDYTGFAQKYGYWEITAKLPGGKAVWPAFWLINGTNNWTGKIPGSVNNNHAIENDIYEYYGIACGPDAIRWSIHDWSPLNGSPSDSINVENDIPKPATANTAYHSYGVLWDSSQMTYYIDRVYTGYSYPVNSTYQDIAYAIVNLGMFGFCGSTLAQADNPTDYMIQKVAVYQLNQ